MRTASYEVVITIIVLVLVCIRFRLLLRITLHFLFDAIPWNDPNALTYRRPILPKSSIHIPPILFKTGPSTYDSLPHATQELHQEILIDNPWITIIYLDDNHGLEFIRSHFPSDVLNAYMNLRPGAYRADLLRYCLLYEFGGIYGDLTQRYLVKLEDMVDRERDRLVLVKDRYQHSCRMAGVQIAFMAAIPKLEVFKKAIDAIVHNVQTNYYGCNPLAITGPVLFRRVLDTCDIPYRMDVEQAGFNTYKFMRPPFQTVAIARARNHRTVLKKAHYSTLWKQGTVFGSVKRQLPVCMLELGHVVERARGD